MLLMPLRHAYAYAADFSLLRHTIATLLRYFSLHIRYGATPVTLIYSVDVAIDVAFSSFR